MPATNQTIISSMGIMCAIGTTLREFSHSLRQGISGIKAHPSVWPFNFAGSTIAARIENFDYVKELEKYPTLSESFVERVKLCLRRAPLGLQISVMATLAAWIDANLFAAPCQSDRVGVIIAGNNLGQAYQFGHWQQFMKKPEQLSPRYGYKFLDSYYVGAISEIFQLHGEGLTVGGATASGNMAILQGMRLLQLDLCDCVLVIGACADLSPVEFQAFHNMGALGGTRYAATPEQACRPFDSDREGFIYGQGSGCLVLEKRTHALNRGVSSRLSVLGGAMSLDANRLPDPNAKGQLRAMQRALDNAQIAVNQIDYINAHATSSIQGDPEEVKAIKALLGDHLSHAWINSTKSLTGHCLWSANIIEAIATGIQLQEQFVHPNLNLINPLDKHCKFVGKNAQNVKLTHALNNGVGFGGINCCVVMRFG